MVEERFEGEQDLDDLWHRYIGSHHMFASDELKKLNGLKDNKVLPRGKIYSLYLMSKHWRWLRLAVLKRDDYQCVQCGSRVELHVDHLHYPGFGREKPKDLQTLCAVCHAKKTTNWDLAAKRSPSKVAVESRQLFSILRRRNYG